MQSRPLTQPTSFWRRFAILYGVGLIGVLGLLPGLLGQLSFLVQSNPALATTPPIVLALLSLIQPAILVGVAVAVGIALAPRLGLRSHIVDAADGAPTWGNFRAELPAALGLGVVGMLVTAGLDIAFSPFMPKLADVAGQQSARSLGLTISGVLYGGIAEELMLRWGLMTLFAWLGWKLAQRGQGTPSAGVMWSALVLAALLFGVGHLGAASVAFGGLTPVVVARTVALNAVAGLLLGWLYWRRSLEAAMLGHATFHIALTVVNLFVVAGLGG